METDFIYPSTWTGLSNSYLSLGWVVGRAGRAGAGRAWGKYEKHGQAAQCTDVQTAQHET